MAEDFHHLSKTVWMPRYMSERRKRSGILNAVCFYYITIRHVIRDEATGQVATLVSPFDLNINSFPHIVWVVEQLETFHSCKLFRRLFDWGGGDGFMYMPNLHKRIQGK